VRVRWCAAAPTVSVLPESRLFAAEYARNPARLAEPAPDPAASCAISDGSRNDVASDCICRAARSSTTS
jgi:hypothetical protein